MATLIDLTGRRFGRLFVEGTAGRESSGRMKWLCQCDCGQKTAVRGSRLNSGKTRSCGCLVKDTATKHGHARDGMVSSALGRWRSMIQRCTNPNTKAFKDYGGRGIAVCERWRSFQNFLADMGEPPTGMSLDRIDNNKGYCPENCRWSTPQGQCSNRRSNRWLEHSGVRMTIGGWSDEVRISRSLIQARIDRLGWSVERALTTPVKSRGVPCPSAN